MRRRHIAVFAVVLFAGLAVAGQAFATAREASFGLRPVTFDPKLPVTRSYYVLALRRGETFHESVSVVNAGATTGTAYLYPVDATTGQTSGAVYLGRNAPRRDVGSWITLDTSKVTLGPGERRTVGFTIHAPKRLSPGEHLGGIVAENARLTVGKGGSALQIRIRHLTIVAVEVKIPGPAVRAVSIGRVTSGGGAGYQRLFVNLRNSGTMMLKPFGTLLLADSSGQTVAQRSFRLDTFLPRTEIDYPVLIPGQALSPGSYTARVMLSFAGKSVDRSEPVAVSRTQYTQVFQGAPALAQGPAGGTMLRLPWLISALTGLGLLACLGIFAYRRWIYYW